MTIALTSSVERYAYSGPGDYSFNFPFPLTSDVYVSYIDTAGVSSDLELNTDYTVAANSDSDGGVVTITSPTSPGGVITIERTLSFTQNTVFENEGPLQMSLIEGAFDRSVMLLQQMNELIDGLKVAISWRYEWEADTEYVTKDVVTEPGGNDWYQCIVDNTSGDTFTADVASGYWVKVLDFTTITNSVASALEGVYPVPTADEEGMIPVVQSDASMAYEDISSGIATNTSGIATNTSGIATNTSDIGGLQTEVDLKAALSLFLTSNLSTFNASTLSSGMYFHVNGVLVQAISIVGNTADSTITWPVAFSQGCIPVLTNVDLAATGLQVTNPNLTGCHVKRTSTGPIRYNVIVIGV